MKRVFCMLFLATTVASADAERTHTVKAGDTCASIAQKYYGDPRLVDPIHRANAELAEKPPPHNLREGQVLVIPPKPPPGSQPDAQLTTVRNKVEVQTPEAKPGKPNDPLFRGNRVSTEEASAADVTFRDETQVKLGERTLVVILGDAKSAAARVGEVQTTLVTGELRAFMTGARKAEPAAIATDAANVKVYSGEAQASVDPAKTTRLAVYGGSSTIDARGTKREVSRGFGSKAEKGQVPTVPRPLPPSPVWTTPPPLTLQDRGNVTVAAEFALPDGTSTRVVEWHVQIAGDGIFRNVVYDAKVAGGTHGFSARVPGAGRYYVRVSAIDDDHFEGSFSRIARTLVVKGTAVRLGEGRRQVTITPSDAFCVRVGNATLARVEGPIVVGAKEPICLRCAPNEQDPTTILAFDTP